ncbi:MAG: ABC transporter ATP-binding protein [Clostridiales bacterium]|nr:ABC transporter ATP-binding protein [Clostridiales bacterium]
MIEVKNLTKRFGSNYAVNDISFTVNDGEILGFLGPNGAGKTTTMNMITGYISATSGDCIINGADILAQPEKAKKNIGYLPENPPLYNDMTVMEYLNFVAEIKKVKPAERKKSVRTLMETVKITDMKNRLTKNLSKGYRQRVGLAQAMMGNPDVLILDEPTIGLDPKQINEMREVIKSLGKKHTVILSSHILTEVSAMCDRVMIISRGKIVASDTTENLSAAFAGAGKLLIRVKAERERVLDALSQIPGISAGGEISREAGTLDFTITSEEDTDIREAVFNAMHRNGISLLMMKPFDVSLEDIFLQVTSSDGGEAQ